MEFKVHVSITPSIPFIMKLFVTLDNKNAIFSIGFTQDELYYSDNFSNFKEIAILDKNSQVLELRGAIKRQYKFENSSELSTLWSFLQKFYNFSSIPDSYPRFTITMKEETKEESKHKNIHLKMKTKNLLPPFKNTNFDFQFNYFPSFSTNYLHINADSYENYFDKDTFQLKDSENTSKFISLDRKLFSLLLQKKVENQKPTTDDYLNIRNQWATLSDEQLNQNKQLQHFITELEYEMTKTDSKLHSELMNILIFDVMLSLYFFTYHMFTFDKYKLNALNYLIENMISGIQDKDSIFGYNGEKYSFLEAESKIFWAYYEYCLPCFCEKMKTSIFPSNDVVDMFFNERAQKIFPNLSEIKTFLSKDFAEFLNGQLLREFLFSKQEHWEKTMQNMLIYNEDKRLFVTTLLVTIVSFAIESHNEIKTSENDELNRKIILSSIQSLDINLVLENTNRLLNYYHQII